MKILLVTNMWPNNVKPYFGSFVANEYKKLQEKGHDVDLVVINGRKSGGNNFAYLRALFELILYRFDSKNKFDVIYCTHAFCVFLSVLCGFQNIAYTNHEGEYFKETKLEKLKLLAYRFCCSARFVNNKMMSKIKYNGPKFFSPALLNPNSISELTMCDAKKALGLSQNVNYIFFPGDPLRPEKNFEFVRNFKNKNRQFFQENNLDILVGGSINPTEMGVYYRASFVTLVTSWYESDGLVFRESLCNIRPFMSFDVGNSSLYSQFGGFIFDSEEVLRALLLKEIDCATEVSYDCKWLDSDTYVSELIKFLTIGQSFK